MAVILAHLSDPHLAPLPRPHWYELFNKRATGCINWLWRRRFIHDAGVLKTIVADLKAQKPDHIACTGDLANIALREEFVRGRAWLEILGDPQQLSLVPGNHDAYVRGAMRVAKEQWGVYMCGDDGGGFPYVRRRGPLALVGLTTAVPTAWGMAMGGLGTRQLAALSQILDTLQREGLFRVLLIHHPPVSEARWYKLLIDAAALKSVIAAHGADLLLHGHDHRAMLNWLDGPAGTRVPAVGVPSASAAPSMAKNAAGYNLYAIDGAPGAWRCEMIARGIDAAGAVTEQKRTRLA
jgi:3',5'-cyclic AMP phosphodiesterase CpdA